MVLVKRTALAALIDDTRDVNGWSDPQVVRQAAGATTRLTTKDISNWRQHGMTQIVPGKIVALARGLQIPAYRVALAVLADAGIDVPVDVRTPEAAIRHDHTLSPRTRDTLIMLIERERASEI